MIPAPPIWGHVLREARRLATAQGDAVPPGVFRVLADLVDFASVRSPEPVVCLGVWSTVRLDWPGLSLEVFDDRIEVYPQTTPDSAFAVWYEAHTPGDAFSDDFERVLPKRSDWEARRSGRP